ncbi:glycine zipper 2TM domain-containing protein [Variovorax sp. IB41]|uniref:glycine zipper 2TM domain-containing protein n=1 Tax=Variovorax sp. IB41 TaxID=2779370 RepID=UPI0018E7648C|nr:glycine zipper 2TM domain-containing protein [Variovorax sp. IB41]MBJ2155926.1 glycine zipper 2TM domain-containing protein [Variovorax sp. IB41]
MDSISPPNLPSGAPASRLPKVLWPVIGVLAVAVAALGGVLLHRQDAGAPPAIVAAAPAAGSPTAPDDFKPEAMPVAPAPAVPPVTTGAAPQAMTAAPAPSPGPGAAPVAAAAPVAPAPPPCAVCGHVESVRPVQKRAQNTTGVGAVAGGVVGGLVGNQFGHGNGRVATTVLGAVGGGFAGNEVEKHVRTVTVYEVAVRMDNGSLRTVETKTAPPIGKPVTLRKGLLRPADGRK